MVLCAIVGCSNRSDSSRRKKKPTNTNFYRIPRIIADKCERSKTLSTNRRTLWLSRIKRADLDPDNPNFRVCGAHFTTGAPADLFDNTNPDWAPSLHLGYSTRPVGSDRHDRSQQRRQRKRCAETEMTGSEEPCGVAAPVPDVPPSPHQAEEVDGAGEETGVYVQTDMGMSDIGALEQECIRLNDCVYTTRSEKVQLEMTEESLRSSEPKVVFYTGIASFTTLLAIFKMLEPFVSHSVNNSLAKFQEFVLFLMKIKLNLQNADLAFRFNVSESTVSRIFDKWLHVAHCRLKSQVMWPERSALQRTMPQAFYDSFGSDVAVIIDCFEIKIERPSSYLPRSETWSTYKGSNTAKYLIGIAPQGIVTFISEGWGGRVSDKHITEHCGLLDNLLPGDVVLADRGFNVADSVGFYRARLHLPAYTKGKKQLSAAEVGSTRKLANVRIHVERVIGLIRNKFLLLKSVLPIDYVTCRQGDSITPLDKIVTVCCALSNLCPSIVAALKEPSKENVPESVDGCPP
ncbi:uncharacterized protein LOC144112615 [Amblyomma americanum]